MPLESRPSEANEPDPKWRFQWKVDNSNDIKSQVIPKGILAYIF